MLANSLDFDNDGIPGYADGFNLLGSVSQDDDEEHTVDFPFAIAGISKLFCDDAEIRIEYDDSDPRNVETALHDPFSLPSGSMRLWRTDAPSRDPRPMKQGGDYIAPGTYSREQLGLLEGKASRRLYVEVVKPSRLTGDLTIDVEYSPRQDVGFIARDRVRVTGTKVELWGAGFQGTPEPVAALVKTAVDDPSDPDWEDLPEGITYGAWMTHHVRLYDPRDSITQMSIDRWPLGLIDQGARLETPEFMCQHFGYEGPLNDGVLWMYLTGDQTECEYNPAWLWRSQQDISPPPRSNATLQKIVDDVVQDLEDSRWKPNPNNPGSFGRRVHADAAPLIRAKRDWHANVIISLETREITSLSGSGNGSGRTGFIEADAIKFDRDYRPKVGDIFDPSRAYVYEIKASSSGLCRQRAS